MKRAILLVLIFSMGLAMVLVPASESARRGQQGWPPPNPGCHYIGHSACGGDDHGQCAAQERHMSQQCDNGQVINGCRTDDYCAKTSKGRVNISGTWAGGRYQIQQHGDSLYITGGGSGPANGAFTGPRAINITWPQTHMTYNASINGNGPHDATRITWDHPPNNIWNR